MSKISSSHTAWTAYVSVFIVAVLVGAIYLYGQGHRQWFETISNIITPLLALTALTSGLFAVLKMGVKRNDRWSIIWLSYLLGVSFWFMSEVVWVAYPFLLGISTPYPSMADVFGLTGYFPVIVGLVLQVSPFIEAFRSKKAIAGLLLEVTVVALAILVLVPPILNSQNNLLEVAVSITYPILDVTVLSMLIPCFLIFLKGTFWRPSRLLILAIALALLGHVLTSWANFIETYYSGQLLELFFAWGYLAAALGFYLRMKQGTSKFGMLVV